MNCFQMIIVDAEHEFYVSDIPGKFKEIAELFLGNPIANTAKVDLEELMQNTK